MLQGVCDDDDHPKDVSFSKDVGGVLHRIYDFVWENRAGIDSGTVGLGGACGVDSGVHEIRKHQRWEVWICESLKEPRPVDSLARTLRDKTQSIPIAFFQFLSAEHPPPEGETFRAFWSKLLLARRDASVAAKILQFFPKVHSIQQRSQALRRCTAWLAITIKDAAGKSLVASTAHP